MSEGPSWSVLLAGAGGAGENDNPVPASGAVAESSPKPGRDGNNDMNVDFTSIGTAGAKSKPKLSKTEEEQLVKKFTELFRGNADDVRRYFQLWKVYSNSRLKNVLPSDASYLDLLQLVRKKIPFAKFLISDGMSYADLSSKVEEQKQTKIANAAKKAEAKQARQLKKENAAKKQQEKDAAAERTQKARERLSILFPGGENNDERLEQYYKAVLKASDKKNVRLPSNATKSEQYLSKDFFVDFVLEDPRSVEEVIAAEEERARAAKAAAKAAANAVSAAKKQKAKNAEAERIQEARDRLSSLFPGGEDNDERLEQYFRAARDAKGKKNVRFDSKSFPTKSEQYLSKRFFVDFVLEDLRSADEVIAADKKRALVAASIKCLRDVKNFDNVLDVSEEHVGQTRIFPQTIDALFGPVSTYDTPGFGGEHLFKAACEYLNRAFRCVPYQTDEPMEVDSLARGDGVIRSRMYDLYQTNFLREVEDGVVAMDTSDDDGDFFPYLNCSVEELIKTRRECELRSLQTTFSRAQANDGQVSYECLCVMGRYIGDLLENKELKWTLKPCFEFFNTLCILFYDDESNFRCLSSPADLLSRAESLEAYLISCLGYDKYMLDCKCWYDGKPMWSYAKTNNPRPKDKISEIQWYETEKGKNVYYWEVIRGDGRELPKTGDNIVWVDPAPPPPPLSVQSEVAKPTGVYGKCKSVTYSTVKQSKERAYFTLSDEGGVVCEKSELNPNGSHVPVFSSDSISTLNVVEMAILEKQPWFTNDIRICVPNNDVLTENVYSSSVVLWTSLVSWMKADTDSNKNYLDFIDSVYADALSGFDGDDDEDDDEDDDDDMEPVYVFTEKLIQLFKNLEIELPDGVNVGSEYVDDYLEDLNSNARKVLYAKDQLIKGNYIVEKKDDEPEEEEKVQNSSDASHVERVNKMIREHGFDWLLGVWESWMYDVVLSGTKSAFFGRWILNELRGQNFVVMTNDLDVVLKSEDRTYDDKDEKLKTTVSKKTYDKLMKEFNSAWQEKLPKPLEINSKYASYISEHENFQNYVTFVLEAGRTSNLESTEVMNYLQTHGGENKSEFFKSELGKWLQENETRIKTPERFDDKTMRDYVFNNKRFAHFMLLKAQEAGESWQPFVSNSFAWAIVCYKPLNPEDQLDVTDLEKAKDNESTSTGKKRKKNNDMVQETLPAQPQQPPQPQKKKQRRITPELLTVANTPNPVFAGNRPNDMTKKNAQEPTGDGDGNDVDVDMTHEIPSANLIKQKGQQTPELTRLLDQIDSINEAADAIRHTELEIAEPLVPHLLRDLIEKIQNRTKEVTATATNFWRWQLSEDESTLLMANIENLKTNVYRIPVDAITKRFELIINLQEHNRDLFSRLVERMKPEVFNLSATDVTDALSANERSGDDFFNEVDDIYEDIIAKDDNLLPPDEKEIIETRIEDLKKLFYSYNKWLYDTAFLFGTTTRYIVKIKKNIDANDIQAADTSARDAKASVQEVLTLVEQCPYDDLRSFKAEDVANAMADPMEYLTMAMIHKAIRHGESAIQMGNEAQQQTSVEGAKQAAKTSEKEYDLFFKFKKKAETFARKITRNPTRTTEMLYEMEILQSDVQHAYTNAQTYAENIAPLKEAESMFAQASDEVKGFFVDLRNELNEDLDDHPDEIFDIVMYRNEIIEDLNKKNKKVGDLHAKFIEFLEKYPTLFKNNEAIIEIHRKFDDLLSCRADFKVMADQMARSFAALWAANASSVAEQVAPFEQEVHEAAEKLQSDVRPKGNGIPVYAETLDLVTNFVDDIQFKIISKVTDLEDEGVERILDMTNSPVQQADDASRALKAANTLNDLKVLIDTAKKHAQMAIYMANVAREANSANKATDAAKESKRQYDLLIESDKNALELADQISDKAKVSELFAGVPELVQSAHFAYTEAKKYAEMKAPIKAAESKSELALIEFKNIATAVGELLERIKRYSNVADENAVNKYYKSYTSTTPDDGIFSISRAAIDEINAKRSEFDKLYNEFEDLNLCTEDLETMAWSVVHSMAALRATKAATIHIDSFTKLTEIDHWIQKIEMFYEEAEKAVNELHLGIHHKAQGTHIDAYAATLERVTAFVETARNDTLRDLEKAKEAQQSIKNKLQLEAARTIAPTASENTSNARISDGVDWDSESSSDDGSQGTQPMDFSDNEGGSAQNPIIISSDNEMSEMNGDSSPMLTDFAMLAL